MKYRSMKNQSVLGLKFSNNLQTIKIICRFCKIIVVEISKLEKVSECKKTLTTL